MLGVGCFPFSLQRMLPDRFLMERRSLPRRLVSAKQCEDGSFRAKAGPTRRVFRKHQKSGLFCAIWIAKLLKTFE
jgi:hypothetical protein